MGIVGSAIPAEFSRPHSHGQVFPIARPAIELTAIGRLLVLSALFGFLLQMAGLPAALLLGPMIAGVLVGTNSGSIRVPLPPHLAAQAILGCLIARSISPTIIGEFLKQWPLFLGLTFLLVLASGVLGWAIGRSGILPGTTAIWGLSPGAASAMMLMAGAFGADAQLVAFMQYLRVAGVAMTASLIARFWLGQPGAAAGHIVWFPPLDWVPFRADGCACRHWRGRRPNIAPARRCAGCPHGGGC